MNLYVWADWHSDYTPGLAVAVAETPEKARALLKSVIPMHDGACEYCDKAPLHVNMASEFVLWTMGGA